MLVHVLVSMTCVCLIETRRLSWCQLCRPKMVAETSGCHNKHLRRQHWRQNLESDVWIITNKTKRHKSILHEKVHLMWHSWQWLEHLDALQWRHNGLDSVSNHQPHHCLLNGLYRRRSKKTSKLRVTGLCAGNSPVTGEFPAQMASNAENVSIWWRHHGEELDSLQHKPINLCEAHNYTQNCYGDYFEYISSKLSIDGNWYQNVYQWLTANKSQLHYIG